MLYVFVKIPDLDASSMNLSISNTRFELSAKSASEGEFRIAVDLFRSIESRTATWSVVHKVRCSSARSPVVLRILLETSEIYILNPNPAEVALQQIL